MLIVPTPGYLGRLRKKCQQLGAPDDTFAWSKKCSFVHPVTGSNQSWLVAKGWDSCESFAVGCFVCRAASVGTIFGKIGVSSRAGMQICNLRGHAIHGCHQKSLQALGRSLEQPHDVAGGADAGQVTGAVSGMSAKVPRLDRWVQTLELVRTHSSYNQLASLAESASVGSSLTPGGDSSPQVAKQMIFAMSEVLSQVDRVMMKKAIKTSISIDKTADYFLLYCRTLTPYGLYDFLGGVEGDVAGDVAAETAAMLKILRRMCTRPEGHRSVDAASIYNHESDRFDSVACSN